MVNADALQRAREEREQREQARLQAVQNAWNAIPGVCSATLGDAPRDWIALECLANEQAYAKPDTEKRFVLWEATQNGAIEASNRLAPHRSVKQPATSTFGRECRR